MDCDSCRNGLRNTALRLVGVEKAIAPDPSFGEEMRTLYGDFFSRAAELKHTGSRPRCVGYWRTSQDNTRTHFIGAEVDRIGDIPDGMIAWELTDGMLTVREPTGGREGLTSCRGISWNWIGRSNSGCRAGLVGEFETTRRKGSNMASGHVSATYHISANAHIDLEHGAAGSDAVHIASYDPAWPQEYDEFASWLRDCLGSDVVLRTEHFGSTAVPNMPAKPIIDVMVEVPSFADAKRRAIPLLSGDLWEYWWVAERTSGHILFVKRQKAMGVRTHHVHIAPRGHELWERLAFRDHLRSHREDAARYAALKYELAEQYAGDRERYTEAKGAFVREVMTRARR